MLDANDFFLGKAVSLGCIKKNLKIAWVRVGQCAVCLREKKMSSRPATLPRGKTGSEIHILFLVLLFNGKSF